MTTLEITKVIVIVCLTLFAGFFVALAVNSLAAMIAGVSSMFFLGLSYLFVGIEEKNKKIIIASASISLSVIALVVCVWLNTSHIFYFIWASMFLIAYFTLVSAMSALSDKLGRLVWPVTATTFGASIIAALVWAGLLMFFGPLIEGFVWVGLIGIPLCIGALTLIGMQLVILAKRLRKR